MDLIDLKDTKGAIECELFNSPTKALEILRRGLAATAASDNGAINIWRDDNGVLRGERMRFWLVQDRQTFQTQKAATAWLKEALAQIQ